MRINYTQTPTKITLILFDCILIIHILCLIYSHMIHIPICEINIIIFSMWITNMLTLWKKKVNIYINSCILILTIGSPLFAWQTNNTFLYISYLILFYRKKYCISLANIIPKGKQKKIRRKKTMIYVLFIFFTSLNANKIERKKKWKEFKTFVYPLLCFPSHLYGIYIMKSFKQRMLVYCRSFKTLLNAHWSYILYLLSFHYTV